MSATFSNACVSTRGNEITRKFETHVICASHQLSAQCKYTGRLTELKTGNELESLSQLGYIHYIDDAGATG